MALFGPGGPIILRVARTARWSVDAAADFSTAAIASRRGVTPRRLHVVGRRRRDKSSNAYSDRSTEGTMPLVRAFDSQTTGPSGVKSKNRVGATRQIRQARVRLGALRSSFVFRIERSVAFRSSVPRHTHRLPLETTFSAIARHRGLPRRLPRPD